MNDNVAFMTQTDALIEFNRQAMLTFVSCHSKVAFPLFLVSSIYQMIIKNVAGISIKGESFEALERN